MLNLLRTLLLFCLAPAILTACQSGPTAHHSPEALYNEWKLVTLGGNTVEDLIPHGAQIPSLTIARDGKVTGYTGVNSLASTIDLDALPSGRFSLGSILTTRRAGAPQLMAVESALVDSLRQADTFSVRAQTLTLSRGPEELITLTTPAK